MVLVFEVIEEEDVIVDDNNNDDDVIVEAYIEEPVDDINNPLSR